MNNNWKKMCNKSASKHQFLIHNTKQAKKKYKIDWFSQMEMQTNNNESLLK